MRRKFWILIFLFLVKQSFGVAQVTPETFNVYAGIKQVDVSVKAEKHDLLRLKLVLLGKEDKKVDQVAQLIKKDLEFSGQFSVALLRKSGDVSTKSDIESYLESDCRLAVFLTCEGVEAIGWRLYDLEYSLLLKGEKYCFKGNDIRGWAHNISDAIWPNLTGQKGFFSTKIAFCKKINRGRKNAYKHIYVADYDGSDEKLLVSTPTVNLAPRWNSDPKRPLVFYSEHTNKNVRLIVADMNKKRNIASNFDGLNILSAFSADGKKFAYCASRGDGSCQIYYFDGKLKKLTNKGNNISPTFADNGNTIYFCSDANTQYPQIYKYDLLKKDDPQYRPEQISKSGFEVATIFNQEKNLLAYSKMVSGTMQIFVYNPKDCLHKQVTFGAGNKEECSWSPCGNYLLFSVELADKNGDKSRLAIQNLLTGKMQFITKPESSCCYPFWSPIYDQFPVVV